MVFISALEVLRLAQALTAVLAGVAALAFIVTYWRMYGRSWNLHSGAWRYIIALNLGIVVVAISTAVLVAHPGVRTFHVLRLSALLVFLGAILGQFVLLRRPHDK